jgi:hypothetical protein
MPGLRRPDRIEAVATAVLVGAAVLALVVPPLRQGVFSVAMWSLEVVGRIVDRPTWLVVVAYVALIDAAAIQEGLTAGRAKRILGSLLAPLGLVTMAYLAAQAALLALAPLVLGVAAAAAGSWWFRGAEPNERWAPPGVLVLFVVLHMAIEGAAGHILTPWLHDIGVVQARLARSIGPLYGLQGAVLIGAPILLVSGARWRQAAAVLGGLALVGLVPGGGWVVVVAASGALGAFAARAGWPILSWAHPDPLALLGRGSVLGLIALMVVTAHYVERTWDCRSDLEGLERLSLAEGTFDLALTGDGTTLVSSLREPQQLLSIDLNTGQERLTSTRKSTDTLWNRTEPETILPVGLSDRLLLLVASSDSEEGNQVVPFEGGRLGRPLSGLGEGVSDLVGDGAGGVWLSTEFAGRLIQLHPRTLVPKQELQLRGAETNKIAVDAATGSAWSAGLWSDGRLRKVDLETGRSTADTILGTHQWDIALDPEARRLYVPRLVDGLVHVFDADTLQHLDAWRAGFGVRPVEVSFDGSLVVTGNLYTGEVIGFDAASGERRFVRHVGGPLKGLRISSEGRIFTGSHCGVFEVQP